MTDEKPSRQKFKWTKELVHIALNDGMTQEEIARVCRTQQSVVSSWKSGKNKATEQQLAELLRRYGARLNRTTARIYLVHEEEEPVGTWQESEIGRRLLELQDRRKVLAAELVEYRKAIAREAEKQKKFAQQQADRDAAADQTEESSDRLRAARHAAARLHLQKIGAKILGLSVPIDVGDQDKTDSWGIESLAEQKLEAEIAAVRKQLDTHSNRCWRLDDLVSQYEYEFVQGGRQRLVQVDGPVLFRYTFVKPIKRERNKRWELGHEPTARWLVHDLQRGKLLLVAQVRRTLTGFQKQRWDEEVSKLDDSLVSSRETSWIDCADDAGRWLSFLTGPLTVEELLQYVEQYLHDPERLHRPHDELVLPYLIRKALAEHGHPVPGIDRITAFE